MKTILFIIALASVTGCCKNNCGPYSSPCFKVDTLPPGYKSVDYAPAVQQVDAHSSGYKSVDYVPQVQQVDTYQPVNVHSSSSNCQCNPCNCNPCGC